jgi:hypothetical protein
VGRVARLVVLRLVVALVALALSAAVAGCAGGPGPSPPAESAGVAPGTRVMVIRHGEKRTAPIRESTHRATRMTAR